MQVPVNPRSSPAEMAGFVAQADPTVIVTDPALARNGHRRRSTETGSAATVWPWSTTCSSPSPTATVPPTSTPTTWR